MTLYAWLNFLHLAGLAAFLFAHGISGDRFPTPFAHPPGKGLSSPTTNVVWALVNLIVGYVLFRVGRVSSGGSVALAVFFTGIAALSIWLSVLFAKISPDTFSSAWPILPSTTSPKVMMAMEREPKMG